jgi:rhamnulokinase
LHILGGGSQNELLCQLTASAIHRLVIAGPVEATSLGNCLIQAKGLGHVRDLSHLRQIVRNSTAPKRYEPADTKRWEEQAKRFVELSTS